MAVKSFRTNDLVAEMDMYKEFDKLRRKEMKVDGVHEKLFYKSGLVGDPKDWKSGWYQKKKKALCKCACMTIAYNIWYKYVNDRAIDNGATSYKKFVDVPKTVLKEIKKTFESEIKAKCCDVNGRIAKGEYRYDFCRYLAMYWTYLDCAKDTTTQRFFPTQMTVTRAAEIFGYEVGDNPFKMNGKYIHHEKEESMKTTGREINPIPEEKVGEIIDEFMKDKLDPKTVSVEDMDFSTRTYLCLQRGNVRTLDQLLRMSPSDIIKIRNLGRRSYEEIKSKVEEYGYIYPNISTPAIVVMDDGKEYINRKIEIKKIVPEDAPEQVKEYMADTSIANVLDNLKAPNAIAKKIYDLEEENEAIRSKYEKLNNMYFKCASEFENLKKENEDLKKDVADLCVERDNLQKTNVELTKDKLRRMEEDSKGRFDISKLHWLESRLQETSEENIKIKSENDKLRIECKKYQMSIPSCRHYVSTIIKEVIDVMCRDKIEEIGIIVDGFVVQIHPRKDERKLGSYTIRTRESIV